MLASCQKLILYSWIDVDAAPLEYCFAGQTTINAVIRTYSDHSCSCQTGVLEHPPAVIIVIAIKKMARSRQLLTRHRPTEAWTFSAVFGPFSLRMRKIRHNSTSGQKGNFVFETSDPDFL